MTEKGNKEITHSNRKAAWARVLSSHLPTQSGPPNVSRELLPGLQVSALKPVPPTAELQGRKENPDHHTFLPLSRMK